MTIQITIIGLGQIGASIGMALAEHKNILRVGHDKNTTTAKTAQKMGAVDKVKHNLPASVKEADIVILSLPFSEIWETMDYIKEDLKEDVVILDTAPSKAATNAWMQKLLPVGCAYIGLAPAINPVYLDEKEFGINAARADLFHNAVTMIAAPPSALGDAVQLAADLVQLIGSQPLFADIVEVDGLMASVQLLPQLTAAALLNATIDHSGWDDARKLTGRAYADTTSAILHHEGAPSLSGAVLNNSENITRVLDRMITSLQEIRENIAGDDKDALGDVLIHAEEERLLWLRERKSADGLSGREKTSPVELAGISERLFGFKTRKPRE